ALEVDQAVVLLVTTTHVTGGNATVVVTTTGLALRLQQRSMRRAFVQIGSNHTHGRTTAGGSGFEFHQWHGMYLRPWPLHRWTGHRRDAHTPCANRRDGRCGYGR